MADIIYQQLGVFLHSLLCGFLVWCIYDVILMLRKTFRHGTVLMAVEDICFWLVAACVIFSMFYTYNYGALRGYAFIGVFLGVMLHGVCVTKPLLLGYEFVLTHLKKIIQKLLVILSKKQKKG